MGRKSLLTPDQWIEIERLHVVDGKSINWLATKFGINESSIRRKIKPNKAESPNHHKPLKELAIEKIRAENSVREITEQIAELPYAKQQIVFDLSKKLVNISNHLASAAEFGVMTAHRLSMIANQQVEMIDESASLEENAESLKSVLALTKTANEAAATGLNLLNANKDAVAAANKAGDPLEKPRSRLDFYAD